MPTFDIPLSPEPQRLNVSLAGQMYTLRIRWNEAESLWVMDIGCTDTGGMLVSSVPLVTGCDLLEPFAHLSFGGELRAYRSQDDVPPGYDDLGIAGGLVFVTESAP